MRVLRMYRSGNINGLSDKLQSGRWMERVLAALFLGRIDDTIARNALLNGLGDSSRLVRYTAAQSLAESRAELSEDELATAVRGNSGGSTRLSGTELRQSGAWMLQNVHTLETLTKELETATDVERTIYLDILGRLGDKEATGFVIKYLSDSHPGVRLSAVEAFGRIRDTDAIQPLISVLEDQDRDVRRAAGLALLKMGQPGRDALLQTSAHGTPMQQREARKALRRFGRTEDLRH